MVQDKIIENDKIYRKDIKIFKDIDVKDSETTRDSFSVPVQECLFFTYFFL